MKPLTLTEGQKNVAETIFIEEIIALKENARKEKTKEISNKASLNTFAFETYKAQEQFEKILNKEQLVLYRELIVKREVPGNTEKQQIKLAKKLKKKGYDLNFVKPTTVPKK